MNYQQMLNKAAKRAFGGSVVDSVIAEKGTLDLWSIRKIGLRTRRLNKEFTKINADLLNTGESHPEHYYPVTCPIALISQIQRSGGSLLSQLFDGHPGLHAHPHELKIGYPKKYIWPRIDLNDSPHRWLELLFEDDVITDAKVGYKKGTVYDQTFPFVFSPALQQKLFLRYIESVKPVTLREVFNAYMTSYFGAWLNNENIQGEKRYVTAFTPRLSLYAENMESFFGIYPDGRLISVIRDPKNWYPSAVRHKIKKDKYKDLAGALDQWRDSACAALENKKKYGDRVCIIRFEDLVGNTAGVMHHLAELLGIIFNEILVSPTFNGAPIKANTNFKLESHGIMESTLSRYTTLQKEELDFIEATTGDSYQAVLKEAVKF